MIAHRLFATSLLLTVLSLGAAAHADAIFEDDSSTPADRDGSTKIRPGVGARIGGYGFRRQSDGKWDDCRMNGLGVFGTLDFGEYFFGELGLDSYQAVKSASGDDAGMDRISILTSVAAGVRMFPDWYVTPYVELGTGVEWTRVDVGSQRTTGTYPIGFFGVGADVNVLRSLKLGSVIRVLGMAHPVLDDVNSPVYKPSRPVDMEYQPAAQAQLYARYVF